MTTYVQRQAIIQVAEMRTGEKEIFRRGDRVTKFEELEALNECETKKYSVAIPETDKDLIEGTTITTGRILYIETDTEITVKLNNTTDTGFKVKPLVDSEGSNKPGTLYMESEFTHVYVTIAGASGNANIFMGVVGA